MRFLERLCITDNRNFWRVVKPNFSNKIVGTNRVILRDRSKIISDAEKVADTFNINISVRFSQKYSTQHA